MRQGERPSMRLGDMSHFGEALAVATNPSALPTPTDMGASRNQERWRKEQQLDPHDELGNRLGRAHCQSSRCEQKVQQCLCSPVRALPVLVVS